MAQANAINYPFTPITSYTPTLSGSVASGTIAYSAQTGVYSVNDGLCTVSFAVIATVTGLPSGDLRISLPVAATQANSYGIGYVEVGLVFSFIGPYSAGVGNSFLTINIASTGANQPIAATSYNLQGTITYFVG